MPIELSDGRLLELATLACAQPRPLPKHLKLERLPVVWAHGDVAAAAQRRGTSPQPCHNWHWLRSVGGGRRGKGRP